MSLKVWLPLNGDLHNQGISNVNITSTNSSAITNGKIGSCMKITTTTNLQYTPNFNISGLSLCGWFKFNQFELATVIDTLNYTSSATTPTGNLIGNTSYGGIGLIWIGNNHYSSGTFSSITAYATLRTSSVNKTTAGASITFDTWVHLALTWDPIDHILSLYKNGDFIGSQTFSAFSDGVSRTLYLNYKAIYGGNGPSANIPMYCNDVRIYDHALSAAEVKEIAQGLVLHYKLDMQYFKSGTNLVTNVTKGGQTTKLTDGRLGVVTSGVNADTYFTINLSESITNGTTYHFSCDASGISEGQYWNFPLGAQNNTSLPCKIYNGHNEFVFTANDINWGTNRLFMDDLNRPDWQHPATFYNFILTKDATYEVKDSSGYGHNGTIIGSPTISIDTLRYSACIHMSATSQHITSGTLSTSGFGNSYSIAWWGKASTFSGTMQWGFSNGIRLNGIYNGNLWNTGDSSNNPLYNPGTTTQVTAPTTGVWHHFVMTGDGAVCKVYKDGVHWGTAKTYKSISGTQIYINGWANSTSYSHSDLSVSDFRIYCTALSAEDVLALYHTGAKVDNKQNLHTYEFNENDSNKLTKTGILKDYAIEPYKTLSDGSYWKLMLFHYVDNGNNLFTSSNATYNNGFGLYSRLRDIANYTYDSKYEYYVIQDGKEFRWTQTSSPTAASITGLTTISGYNNPVNGLAKPSSLTQTYIGYNSWWGACGCWTKYSTGGKTGIPGFGSHDGNGICTNYLALYTRIEKSKAEIANENIYAENLIEF